MLKNNYNLCLKSYAKVIYLHVKGFSSKREFKK
jgi:hypothetical protein